MVNKWWEMSSRWEKQVKRAKRREWRPCKSEWPVVMGGAFPCGFLLC